MDYKSLLINFMSGTGNSFRAAAWMTKMGKQRGIRSELYPIARCREESDVDKGSGELLGVVFPTHGFTAPWHVIRYALRLPSGRGKHAFVVVTRAGSRIASIPFPGMEGTAGYLIALILILKGYSVRGVMGLDMPSNWIALHWGLNSVNSGFIIDRAKVKADAFINSILEGKKGFRGIVPLILGLMLSPVSLGYLIIGRFFLSKLFFASGDCTGCGLCAESCPVKAIKMVGNSKHRPYWTFACESCMRCMGYCPNQAVEVSHPFAVILYFLATLPVSVYILNELGESAPMGPYLFVVSALLNYSYILFVFFIANLVLFLLIQIPLLNKLCTYTTLTHIYRRYHEPDTKLGDMLKKQV